MTGSQLLCCPHLEDGWCLECVKRLWEETEQLRTKHRNSYGFLTLAQLEPGGYFVRRISH